jgi:large subunit ribosomal protein L22
LNKLANQIGGKPIDYAILQMHFSEKRVSAQVERLLLETKQKAKEQGMNLDQLVVSQAWVGKGPKSPKKIDIRARGKFGIIRKSRSTMTIRLGRGLTERQLLEKRAQRALDKIKIPELVKDEKKVRFSRSQWAW